MTIAAATTGGAIRTVSLLGTSVTMQVVGAASTAAAGLEREAALDRAFDWFRRVEATCSRFDPDSELRRLSSRAGQAVPVSPMLFEAVRFALILAADTGGAFDPTVGARMAARGFNQHYRTGARVDSASSPGTTGTTVRERLTTSAIATSKWTSGARPSRFPVHWCSIWAPWPRAWRSISRPANCSRSRTMPSMRAATSISPARTRVGSRGPSGSRHPRLEGALIDTLRVSGCAVCTSGDYERRASVGSPDHHLVDARTGATANVCASATVVAPTAMVADALATAAFVLGPVAGLGLLERHGVQGLIISAALERHETPGLPR